MVESDGIRQNLLDEVTGDDSNYMPPMGDPETGLTEHEVSIRRAHFGYNELADKEENILLKFLSYFWGPMPIMIWIAILVEFINEEWPDFGVLLFLQVVNGCVGFFEEQEAGDAIAALKDKLAPKCTVRREGVFKTIEARDLVPGDVVNLKLGDIIPADCLLLEGHPLEVDQAALTGESLPVTIYPHESLKMGATIKRGENLAHVTATGSNTFFGKAASMVASVESQGRFQLVLFKISMVLLSISVVATLVILITLLSRDVSILRAIGVCVVLLVASIPIAMQVVSTSTMAMGARKLAEKNVIVAKLSAIEEMAGMKILCSDKTGMLTQNKLELNDPIVFSPTPMNGNELFFLAALAAKRMEEGMDAIDTCICQTLSRVDPSLWREVEESYEELDFHPFDPVSKFTAATVRGPDGVVFKTMKGAPQVVLRMCNPSPDLEARVSAAVQDLADRGYRAIGVAKTDESSNWVFTGVLSLFDPPRIDTEMTIKEAQKMGIEVKMITGDQLAIAKETCRQLGMGTNILGVELLDAAGGNIPGVSGAISDIVRDCNGFAEVFPEHKFQIVSILMESGFICGMTGDGVNDAPALKRANIGIAVADSTDAARAASDIVLTEPGLKEIIDALVNSRKIFSRVRNYCMYRISATLSLVGFFFVAVLAYNPENYFPSKQRNIGTSSTLFSDESSDEHESVFTLPVIALVMITILNDGTIITICRDYVVPF
jgi:H+-transporting ATPase